MLWFSLLHGTGTALKMADIKLVKVLFFKSDFL